ncbi:MAG: class I SAM-dependent methyltransferase [Chromatiaceae bacterium]|nr:class I SAM-dependent methyltransferase [Chromatiaceae bacterium]
MHPHRSAPRRHAALALAAAALLTSLPWVPVRAEAPAVDPSINTHYHNTNVERWREIFESPGREVFDQRLRIVKASGVRPGMAVADVGAGTGLFTMLFARAVGPEGRVYAVDISPSFVEGIEARSGEYRVDNVEAIVNDQRDTRLPPESVDLVFVSDTYHHFEHPRAMLDSIRKALRPGGELVVIDFHRIPGRSSPWILSGNRGDPRGGLRADRRGALPARELLPALPQVRGLSGRGQGGGSSVAWAPV